MRRDDREVCGIAEIFDILSRCDTIRLGMNGGEYPYVIPMTFGAEIAGDRIVVYFHSAGAGRKWEILQRDPRVCVEADLYYQVERREGSVTAKYESVIGTGTAERLTEQKDKVAALRLMLEHYKESGFPVTSCTGLATVEVFRVPLPEITGKMNL